MDSIKDILKRFDPFEDKYISREFQAYGCYLAEKLGEERRKSLYIKLAKTLPRPVLEKALSFVIDSNARSKGALFMWKLKDMGIIGQDEKKPKRKSLLKEKTTDESGEKVAKKTKKKEPKEKKRKTSKVLEKEYAPASDELSLF